MKNIYETPIDKDFFAVDLLLLIHQQGAHFTIPQYRKGDINLRLVVDFREFNEKLVVFDESRSDEYSKAMEEWHKNQKQSGELIPQGNGTFVINANPQPQVPVKNIQLQGTTIVYHNTQERIIMLPLEEWRDTYFGYLKTQKLDIN